LAQSWHGNGLVKFVFSGTKTWNVPWQNCLVTMCVRHQKSEQENDTMTVG